MERVSGLGGVFFRAEDPGALEKWYADHLGVDPVPTNETMVPWTQESGPTVFAPFEKDTEYFGNTAKAFMLNFRVRDLEAMIAQLEAAGIAVRRDTSDAPYGKFAWLNDPEGNPIELWQPE